MHTSFKISPSQSGKIMAGSIGLTEKQGILLDELEHKFNNPPTIPMPAGKVKTMESLIAKHNDSESKPLTEKQIDTMNALIYLRDNPKVKTLTDNQINTMRDLQEIEKNIELPAGAKTHCKTWLKEQPSVYNRRKQFTSKYTQKGNEVELESIEFIGEQLNLSLIKNEAFYFDSHIHGTPDIVLKDTVIDVKNSWDCFTFPLYETEIPSKDYWWQLQCYMAITNRKHAKLIYVLSNTPDHLIEREAWNAMRNDGADEDEYVDYYEDARERLTYDDIDDSLKIKVFEFDRDDDAIESIFERVDACRNYISQLLKTV